ncbi:hypothetical protein HB826_11145 [Listeria fleischmannii]|nr:hypothetical protein [Listeria fleischmannii]
MRSYAKRTGTEGLTTKIAVCQPSETYTNLFVQVFYCPNIDFKAVLSYYYLIDKR